jgi:outer membrane protein insertion porin family
MPSFLKNNDIAVISSARYAEKDKAGRVGLVKDRLWGTALFAGVDYQSNWENDDRYHLTGQGGEAFVGLPVASQTKVTLKYGYRELHMFKVSDTAPQVFQDDQGRHAVADVGLVVERSTTDDKFYPTRGTLNRLEFDHAAAGLGSDYDFQRLEWQTRGYWTPGQFFTYAFRTKLGWVQAFDGSDEVPYAERYFAGGTGTVRGYSSRHVGPLDSADLPLGGDFLWVNNFETRFPLYKKLAGVVFLDAGGVWEKSGEFNARDLCYGTGVGLRYITRWGVLRLDYGVRLSHQSGESGSHFHASFGMPF